MKTIQRNSILNYLKSTTSHPTAKEIFTTLSEKEKFFISMATVYNTLKHMKKKGLVRELALPNFDYKRYDANLTPHAHLVCNLCGHISNVFFPLHAGLPKEHRQGFFIQESEINFYGLCPLCITEDKKPALNEDRTNSSDKMTGSDAAG